MSEPTNAELVADLREWTRSAERPVRGHGRAEFLAIVASRLEAADAENARLRERVEAFEAAVGKALEHTEHDRLRCSVEVDTPLPQPPCTCWRAEASRLFLDRHAIHLGGAIVTSG